MSRGGRHSVEMAAAVKATAMSRMPRLPAFAEHGHLTVPKLAQNEEDICLLRPYGIPFVVLCKTRGR